MNDRSDPTDTSITSVLEQTPAATNQSWISGNWDKFVFPLIGLIAAGLAGFYSGTYSVRAALSTLSVDVNSNKTEISYIKPKTDQIADIEENIRSIEQSLKDLQNQNVISLQTRELIAQKDSLVRQYTIEYLKDMLQDIK